MIWVAIAVSAIVVAYAAISPSAYQEARLAGAVRTANEIRTIRGAMSAYYAQNGAWPASISEMVSGGFLTSEFAHFSGTPYSVSESGGMGQVNLGSMPSDMAQMVQSYYTAGGLTVSPVGGGTSSVALSFVPPGDEAYLAPINAQIDALVALYAGILPSGALVLSESGCPDGWPQTAEFDGRFIMSSASPASLGGSTTHNHDFSNHSHGGPWHGHGGWLSGTGGGGGASDTIRPTGQFAGPTTFSEAGHTHENWGANIGGGQGWTGGGTGTSANADHTPLYRGILTCRKS